MAISTVNYPTPVLVNGFSCQNCTQVDEAKAHIDPQHPDAGPYGIDAKADPSLSGKRLDAPTGAVAFGGSLGGSGRSGSSSAAPPSSPRGGQLDLSV